MLPVIFGLSGPVLTPNECAFFKRVNPAGFILFARNIEHPLQLRALTDALRELTGRAALPILIDQEGGRIARLSPPHWRTWPAAAALTGSAATGSAGDVARAVERVRCNYEALGLGTRVGGHHGDMRARAGCPPARRSRYYRRPRFW